MSSDFDSDEDIDDKMVDALGEQLAGVDLGPRESKKEAIQRLEDEIDAAKQQIEQLSQRFRQALIKNNGREQNAISKARMGLYDIVKKRTQEIQRLQGGAGAVTKPVLGRVTPVRTPITSPARPSPPPPRTSTPQTLFQDREIQRVFEFEELVNLDFDNQTREVQEYELDFAREDVPTEMEKRGRPLGEQALAGFNRLFVDLKNKTNAEFLRIADRVLTITEGSSLIETNAETKENLRQARELARQKTESGELGADWWRDIVAMSRERKREIAENQRKLFFSRASEQLFYSRTLLGLFSDKADEDDEEKASANVAAVRVKQEQVEEASLLGRGARALVRAVGNIFASALDRDTDNKLDIINEKALKLEPEDREEVQRAVTTVRGNTDQLAQSIVDDNNEEFEEADAVAEEALQEDRAEAERDIDLSFTIPAAARFPLIGSPDFGGVDAGEFVKTVFGKTSANTHKLIFDQRKQLYTFTLTRSTPESMVWLFEKIFGPLFLAWSTDTFDEGVSNRYLNTYYWIGSAVPFIT